MKRSILVVICDFIINSLIFFNSGLSTMQSPFHDTGGSIIDRHTTELIVAELDTYRTELEKEREALFLQRQKLGATAANEAALEQLNQALSETRAKMEFMEKRMNLTREELGEQTPQQLQQEMEEQMRRKALLQTELEKVEHDLEFSRSELNRTVDHLNSLQNQHAEALKNLAERSRVLDATRETLSTTQNDLARTSERLSAREGDLARTSEELSGTKTALNETSLKLTSVESSLAFLEGRSSAMEKELAASRDRLDAAQKAAKNREAELSASKTQLENLQGVLKNAVGDLSKTKTQLQATEEARQTTVEALSQLEGNYKVVQEQLANAEEKLRSDVLTRYQNATMRLNVEIQESRLLGDRDVKSTLFLPAVNLNGKLYLVDALRTLTNLRENASSYSDVTLLNYNVALPTENSSKPLTGPLYISEEDCRIALLQLPETAEVQPLKIITQSELKQRGIHDLYLFKSNSFGKDSTILDARCSMSLDDSDSHLYIRNGARASSELKAEPGDLVLTKQGELAGIVIAQESFDLGRRVEARCFTFDKLPMPEAMRTLPLQRQGGEKYYQAFADQLKKIQQEMTVLDDAVRR